MSAVFLAAALALPPSAHALRVENAGMEESSQRRDLERRLRSVSPSTTGLEERYPLWEFLATPDAGAYASTKKQLAAAAADYHDFFGKESEYNRIDTRIVDRNEKLQALRRLENAWENRLSLVPMTAIFNFYRQLGSFEDMVRFYERFAQRDELFGQSVAAFNDYVLARNRLGSLDAATLDRVHQQIRELEEKTRTQKTDGRDPDEDKATQVLLGESYIGLGTNQKNQYAAVSDRQLGLVPGQMPSADEVRQAEQALAQAKEFYSQAFEADLSYYSGNNVLRTLIYQGRMEEARQLSALVQRTVFQSDYRRFFWEMATLLEIALLNQDSQELIQRLQSVLQVPRAQSEADSLLEHLRRWSRLEQRRTGPSFLAGTLDAVIDILQTVREPLGANALDSDSIRGQLSETTWPLWDRLAGNLSNPVGLQRSIEQQVEDITIQIGRYRRATVLDNNFHLGGLIPPVVLNLTDRSVLRGILSRLGLMEDVQPRAVLQRIYGYLENRFHLKNPVSGERDLEVLNSPRHVSQIDELFKKLFSFTSAREAGIAGTNLSSALEFGAADCRFLGFAEQGLLEERAAFRNDRENRAAYQAWKAGNGEAYDRALEKARRLMIQDFEFGGVTHKNLSREIALFQVVIEGPLQLEQNILKRNSSDIPLYDPQGTRKLEDHTLVAAILRDSGGKIQFIVLIDPWYHETYRLGYHVISRDQLERHLAGGTIEEKGLPVAGGARAYDEETGQIREVDLALKPVRYAQRVMDADNRRLKEPRRYLPEGQTFFAHPVKPVSAEALTTGTPATEALVRLLHANETFAAGLEEGNERLQYVELIRRVSDAFHEAWSRVGDKPGLQAIFGDVVAEVFGASYRKRPGDAQEGIRRATGKRFFYMLTGSGVIPDNLTHQQEKLLEDARGALDFVSRMQAKGVELDVEEILEFLHMGDQLALDLTETMARTGDRNASGSLMREDWKPVGDEERRAFIRRLKEAIDPEFSTGLEEENDSAAKTTSAFEYQRINPHTVPGLFERLRGPEIWDATSGATGNYMSRWDEYSRRLVENSKGQQGFIKTQRPLTSAERFSYAWDDKNDPVREYSAVRLAHALNVNVADVVIPPLDQRQVLAKVFGFPENGSYFTRGTFNYRLQDSELRQKDPKSAFTRILLFALWIRLWDLHDGNMGTIQDSDVQMLHDLDQAFSREYDDPNKLINEIVIRQFVSWISNVGEDSPIYPTDPDDFLGRISLEELGRFLREIRDFNLEILENEIHHEIENLLGTAAADRVRPLFEAVQDWTDSYPNLVLLFFERLYRSAKSPPFTLDQVRQVVKESISAAGLEENGLRRNLAEVFEQAFFGSWRQISQMSASRLATVDGATVYQQENDGSLRADSGTANGVKLDGERILRVLNPGTAIRLPAGRQNVVIASNDFFPCVPVLAIGTDSEGRSQMVQWHYQVSGAAKDVTAEQMEGLKKFFPALIRDLRDVRVLLMPLEGVADALDPSALQTEWGTSVASVSVMPRSFDPILGRITVVSNVMNAEGVGFLLHPVELTWVRGPFGTGKLSANDLAAFPEGFHVLKWNELGQGRSPMLSIWAAAGLEEREIRQTIAILEEAAPQGDGILVLEAGVLGRAGLEELVDRMGPQLGRRFVLFGKESAAAKEAAARNGILLVDSDDPADLALRLAGLEERAGRIGYVGNRRTAELLARILPASMPVTPLDPAATLPDLFRFLGYPASFLDRINASGLEESLERSRAA